MTRHISSNISAMPPARTTRFDMMRRHHEVLRPYSRRSALSFRSHAAISRSTARRASGLVMAGLARRGGEGHEVGGLSVIACQPPPIPCPLVVNLWSVWSAAGRHLPVASFRVGDGEKHDDLSARRLADRPPLARRLKLGHARARGEQLAGESACVVCAAFGPLAQHV